jgi:hypothetical protein
VEISTLEGGDTMEERIGRIGRIRTDFLIKIHGFQAKKAKKIRSYPPNPFFHRISTFQNSNFQTTVP